jgi:hypothetical protein
MAEDLTIHFTTDLGAQVSVSVDGPSKVLELQRRYGKRGWYSGPIPPGGFVLPYDNDRDFDWSLLGGRMFTNREGDICVWARGHVWKRREFAAVESKRMTLPPAVKYSRGAKPTDPPEIREQGDGEIEYVTLAIFRGGSRREEYALLLEAPNDQPPPTESRSSATAPSGQMVTRDQASEFFSDMVLAGIKPQDLKPFVKEINKDAVNDLTKLTISELEQVRQLALDSVNPPKVTHPRMPSERIKSSIGFEGLDA